MNKYKYYFLIAGLTFWLFRTSYNNDLFIVFVLLYSITILINKPSLINNPPINIKPIKIIIYISLALIITTLFIKFLSFGYHYLDLGYDHHLSINLLNNIEYFNKVYNISGFGDHFSPSFVPLIYLFYSISASSYWLIFLKCASITIFTLLLLKLNEKLSPIILLSYLLFSAQNHEATFWEFDTTSLMPALVIIVYYSVINKNSLVFWIAMIFSLGLKENAGVIWVCYGLYFVLFERKIKFGVLIAGIGLLYMLIVWYIVIPFFAQIPNNVASDINLFRDIPLKIKYIFMAYAPFFFLPFLNWRWLLFTLPALGINLIGKPEMYTGNFLYADIMTALIAVASLANLTDNYERIKDYLFKNRVLVLFPIIIIVLIIPESPMQKFVRFFPNEKNMAAFFELQKFWKSILLKS